MSGTEHTNVIEILQASQSEFREAVSAWTDERGAAQSAPEKWSVLQCVEHVIAVEERFFHRLQVAERLPESIISHAREDDLTTRVLNRTTRFEAPELVRPVGRFSTLREAIKHFDDARSQTIEYAAQHENELPFVTIDHPRFGKMTGRELLFVMAGHTRRHAAQVKEYADVSV